MEDESPSGDLLAAAAAVAECCCCSHASMMTMVDCTGHGGCYYGAGAAAAGDQDGAGADTAVPMDEVAADVAVVVEWARKRAMWWVMTFDSVQEVVRRCRSGTVLVRRRTRRKRSSIRGSGVR